eukprot:TRINITY_DN14991_c0_g1_i1.p1 TRINITY_DN14991_c0_g1~~TRINITY_DN14991_c0_g1_i1.p1  ORF type:complete len:1343 (+),score=379.93 TRINITY_DN14991_c0_g1_i1:204-4232(+)
MDGGEWGLPAAAIQIGVPKEQHGVYGMPELRVALTPDGVRDLKLLGHIVVVERGAGEAAGFSDDDYRAAGGRLCSRTEALDSSVILKIWLPEPAGEGPEIRGIKHDAVLLCRAEHPPQAPGQWDGVGRDEVLRGLHEKGVTVVAQDRLAEQVAHGHASSEAQAADAAGSQEVVLGYHAARATAQHFRRCVGGVLGPAVCTPPCKVAVLCGGAAGLHAMRALKDMGADVCGYDESSENREQMIALGVRCLLPPGSAGGADRRRSLTDFLRREAESCDAVIAGEHADERIWRAAVDGGTMRDISAGERLEAPVRTLVRMQQSMLALMPGQASLLWSQHTVSLFQSLQLARGTQGRDQLCAAAERLGVREAVLAGPRIEAELGEQERFKAEEEMHFRREMARKRQDDTVFEAAERRQRAAWRGALLYGVLFVALLLVSPQKELLWAATVALLAGAAAREAAGRVPAASYAPLLMQAAAAGGLSAFGALSAVGGDSSAVTMSDAATPWVCGGAACFSAALLGGLLCSRKLAALFRDADPSCSVALGEVPANRKAFEENLGVRLHGAAVVWVEHDGAAHDHGVRALTNRTTIEITGAGEDPEEEPPELDTIQRAMPPMWYLSAISGCAAQLTIRPDAVAEREGGAVAAVAKACGVRLDGARVVGVVSNGPASLATVCEGWELTQIMGQTPAEAAKLDVLPESVEVSFRGTHLVNRSLSVVQLHDSLDQFFKWQRSQGCPAALVARFARDPPAVYERYLWVVTGLSCVAVVLLEVFAGRAERQGLGVAVSLIIGLLYLCSFAELRKVASVMRRRAPLLALHSSVIGAAHAITAGFRNDPHPWRFTLVLCSALLGCVPGLLLSRGRLGSTLAGRFAVLNMLTALGVCTTALAVYTGIADQDQDVYGAALRGQLFWCATSLSCGLVAAWLVQLGKGSRLGDLPQGPGAPRASVGRRLAAAVGLGTQPLELSARKSHTVRCAYPRDLHYQTFVEYSGVHLDEETLAVLAVEPDSEAANAEVVLHARLVSVQGTRCVSWEQVAERLEDIRDEAGAPPEHVELAFESRVAVRGKVTAALCALLLLDAVLLLVVKEDVALRIHVACGMPCAFAVGWLLAAGEWAMPIDLSAGALRLGALGGAAVCALGLLLAHCLLLIGGAMLAAVCATVAAAAPRLLDEQGEEAGPPVRVSVEGVADACLTARAVAVVAGCVQVSRDTLTPLRSIAAQLAERGKAVRFMPDGWSERFPGECCALLAEAGVTCELMGGPDSARPALRAPSLCLCVCTMPGSVPRVCELIGPSQITVVSPDDHATGWQMGGKHSMLCRGDTAETLRRLDRLLAAHGRARQGPARD